MFLDPLGLLEVSLDVRHEIGGLLFLFSGLIMLIWFLICDGQPDEREDAPVCSVFALLCCVLCNSLGVLIVD